MYESLDVFRTSAAMARHAGARQLVTAQNLANADTPGYRAMTLGGFQEAWREGPGLALRASRPGHLTNSVGETAVPRPQLAQATDAAPNGNTVSVEQEMLASVEAQREHSRALAIWRHGMTVIRTTLGR
jgi:flagellar basal-body rod protein FlgB